MAGENPLRAACAALLFLTVCHAVQDGMLMQNGSTSGLRETAGDSDCGSCSLDYDPVCGKDNSTYSNKCYAECQLEKGAWRPGRCQHDELNPVAGCVGTARCAGNPCEQPWPSTCQNQLPADAVCFLNPCTGIQYQGQDLAACAPLWVDPASKQLVRCEVAAPKPCTCTKELAPVCGSDGKTYSNECMAACELGPGANWTEGACKESCICPMVYSPVCGSNGKTYSNGCFAACELGDEGSWTDGECEDLNPFAGCIGNVRCAHNSCDDGCADAPAGAVCYQNTCTDQVLNGEPVDPCAAVWVDPVTKQAAVCPAPKPTISCSTNETAECFADPCSVSSCPADPTATCLASYCVEGTFQGQPVGPCEAVYVDADGNRVDCDPLPAVSCPSAAYITCLADLCSVSSCPADPTATCIINYCEGATFQGQPVAPCEVVYVDSAGNRVDCNATNITSKPIISCSTNETAECFADPCSVSSCPADPTATCLSSYCVEGTFQDQPVGPCEAVYVDADGNRVDCNSVEPYVPSISCATNKTAECLADPCSVSSCPADPTATCLASYCVEGTFQDQPVGPCEAVFVDTWGKRVDCTAPNDIYACAPDSAFYKCKTPLPCESASCPAFPNAKCITKPCTSTYRGVELLPCSAIWVDPDTGDLVTNCDAEPVPEHVPEINCPKDMGVQCLANPCSVSSCPADPSARCLASYCSEGTFQGQPVGPCEAVYVDTSGKRVDCSTPTISCSTNETAACYADPCSVSSCPADPTATCLSSYCVEGTIGNRTVGPCEAVYIDAGGNPVDCWPPVEPDIYTCPPGAPRVMCTRENSDPCANATCGALPGAECISKPCVSTYGGVELPACAAIWINPNTFELVSQCELAFGRGCSCPYTYEPVCAKANRTSRTYPNSCAAACANATITKTGKCQHCNGAECTIGKMNDVCLLNAPSETQCWAKKYECRAAEGTPAGRGLGRCLPRDNSTAAAAAGKQGRRLHRHLLDEREAA